MTDCIRRFRPSGLVLALGMCAIAAHAPAQVQMRSAASPTPQVVISGPSFSGDYIVAIVNTESVTAAEVEQRIQQARGAIAARGGQPPPITDLMRQQALESLIEERVLLTYARESGIRVDDAEVDRAVQGVAAQNKLTMAQLRERLRAEGIEFARFRTNLRDQILMERAREREVGQRTRITDAEIDKYLEDLHASSARDTELNIAQILVSVPEGASGEQLAQRQARADAALARVRAGEDFATVAREVSEDGNRARGGEIGLRPASRLPDPFVAQVRNLKPGEVSPTILRTGAGLHILKLIDRRDVSGVRVTQTRARHILLRPSAQLSEDAAKQRLAEMRAQIESGRATFEGLARQYSEDSSAAQGGDLGWTNPGSFVPEFETAMNRLTIGGLSQPVVSRFGVHLIEVVERREATLDAKQVREQARAALRELKFEEAYLEWLKDLRSRAYVEMRDPP